MPLELQKCIGQLIFWAVVFGLVLCALIYFDKDDCPPKVTVNYETMRCVVTAMVEGEPQWVCEKGQRNEQYSQ